MVLCSLVLVAGRGLESGELLAFNITLWPCNSSTVSSYIVEPQRSCLDALVSGDEPMVVMDTHLDWRFMRNVSDRIPDLRPLIHQISAAGDWRPSGALLCWSATQDTGWFQHWSVRCLAFFSCGILSRTSGCHLLTTLLGKSSHPDNDIPSRNLRSVFFFASRLSVVYQNLNIFAGNCNA